MSEIDKKYNDTIKFVINELEKLCLKRNFEEAAKKCNSLLFEAEIAARINNLSYFKNIVDQTYHLIDELKFIIQTEIRYVLFPLPDIKKEAYEIGKKYMKNFLEWINPSENYTSEKLMVILSDEAFRLGELKQILDKISKKVNI